MLWKRSLWLLIVVLGLGLVAAGCSDDDDDGGQNVVPVDQFEVVRTAADAYLTDLGAGNPIVASSAVYEANFITAETTDDYFILSVRGASHYAIGHAEGAVNRSWRTLDPTWATATLPQDDSPIAVYCYTGHTGQVGATALGLLGYNVKNVKHGMYAWNNMHEAVTGYSDDPNPIRPYVEAADYGYNSDAVATDTYELPTLDVSSSTNADEIVAAAVTNWLTTGTPTITASAVYDNMNDGDDTNDYFIISVRSSTHYGRGHVPGAINIPYKEIAKPENLAKIPSDKTIVVYCYTGHTGQVATSILGFLGYDVRNMKFGFYAWNDEDPNVSGLADNIAPYDYGLDYDYPIEGTYDD